MNQKYHFSIVITIIIVCVVLVGGVTAWYYWLPLRYEPDVYQGSDPLVRELPEFKEILSKVITYGIKEDVQEFTKAGIALLNFADRFPNSKYADDAEFVVLWFASTDTIVISRWEKFVEKYPDGKVEDFTVDYMRKALDLDIENPTFFEMHIPYGLLLTYLKGQKAFVEDKNFNKTEKYFSELVEKLDHNDPKLKGVFEWVYPALLLSYKNLDRREEYEKIKSEYIVLFPERREKIEEIWPSLTPR